MEESGEPIEPSEEEWFYENDFNRIAEDFIKRHYTNENHRLVHYFDGHLHCYTGTFYEKLTNSNIQPLRRKIREYVKTLKLVDKKGPVPTPTTTQFFKQFEAALGRVCELTKEEAEKFRTQPPHLVYGKTKIWDMETDTFHEYNPTIQTNYTLKFDVADNDKEPPVWKKFFKAANMDDNQQRAWWYMLSVILMRDKGHNRLFYLVGNPRSGKSMTSEICRAMFGREQAGAITGNMSSTHATSIVVGKLLLTVSEVQFNNRTNKSFVQLLLNLVGDDPLLINPKFKELYDYPSEANMVITLNDPPNFKGNLCGLENKFAFLVFHRTGEIDLTLKSRMMRTMPKIIRKAAKMYKEAVDSGYAFDTEQGRKIAKQFLESSSVARAFVEEECVLGEGYHICTTELYREYKRYAGERGEPHQSESDFAREIMTLHLGQIEKKRVTRKKITVFKGIRLASPSDLPQTPPGWTKIDECFEAETALTERE